MTDENVENKNFKTGFYHMSVNIHYHDVILKLNECKQMSQVL
jgi:cell division protein YceG involved in septum cleavage